MAEIEEEIRDDLLARSSVTDLVGSDVYTYEAGDGAIDSYIVVTNPTNQRGAFTQTAYGGVARVAIYCYAMTVAKAQTLGNAVLDAYKRHRGAVQNLTVEWVEVSNARLIHGPHGEVRYLVDLIVHYN